jgi:hypothetical protein
MLGAPPEAPMLLPEENHALTRHPMEHGERRRLLPNSIANHPELELVGLWVHSEKKAGRDAGELCGLPPTGITASQDAEALLALDADCVVCG